MTNKTSDHYTLQWGGKLAFADFVKSNPEAAKVMPSRVLPWPRLFERIRSEGGEVYDAACGFGDIAQQLLAVPPTSALSYLGADIQQGVEQIEAPAGARFVQWDITRPLEPARKFDFVLCRAAMHHTPDPAVTCKVLAQQVKDGGTLAFSVYAKKSPMREATDDALRAQIVPMENETAFATARQFSELGRQLQAVDGKIVIEQDLPVIGIKAGAYSVQGFIYEYFLKCWYNHAFSAAHCDLVNFDWYHPPYAYRFTLDEAKALATEAGLTVAETASMPAQHYIEAAAAP